MDPADPFRTVQQIAGGYGVSRALHVVADLGVADVLDDDPRTAADLASAVGASPDALARILRLLAAFGVFAAVGDRFRHTDASRLLRTDHPESMRPFVRMFGLPINWTAYGALEHSVRTGQPALNQILSGGFWQYLAQHPAESRIFDGAMAAKARGQVAAVVAAYDFSRFRKIGDIGGGRGHLLRAVLASTPTATGVLFDQPHVIDEVSSLSSGRLTLQPGDFFRDPLPACDAYLLMEVIHDWADAEAAAILTAVRHAAPQRATLLLIESIVPEDAGPDWSKLLDVHMLTLAGGRQRTKAEYAHLLASAGFVLEHHIDTGADIAILEAVAARSAL